MIQETLVRSASRRAAARKAGLLPNSPNERSDVGPRRGSGSDGAYSWSRKGSLEGSGSGSDGRRGSESDGKWGSGSDGRRGSDGVPAATQRRRSSGMESGLAPSAYRSSRATGTSATGSSPQTNGAPTPSSQSDAFEFSSLVGSRRFSGLDIADNANPFHFAQPILAHGIPRSVSPALASPRSSHLWSTRSRSSSMATRLDRTSTRPIPAPSTLPSRRLRRPTMVTSSQRRTLKRSMRPRLTPRSKRRRRRMSDLSASPSNWATTAFSACLAPHATPPRLNQSSFVTFEIRPT